MPDKSAILPRAIWSIGLVSLFMDMSSEMIHSLLPVFLVSVLGASATYVGLIEGMAEATASITKLFSGALSDFIRNRKWLAVLGYGLSAMTKPLFPLASSIHGILFARLADRVGKGIRGAPRDALVAEITPIHQHGAAYGLRQSLDTVGAIAGPLLAVGLMFMLSNDIRSVFWFSIPPAFIAVVLLVWGVKEPKRVSQAIKSKNLFNFKLFKRLGAAYWWVVAIGAVLALARFSEAFLILRAGNLGMPTNLLPLVLIIMNVVYALTSYPAGKLADRMDRGMMLIWGFFALIGADLVLAWTGNVFGALIGACMWGLHMGLTQGLLSALVASSVKAELRATAFGLFNLVSGLTLLIASVIAGVLWDFWGATSTFLAGAAFTCIALLGFLIARRMALFKR